MDMAFLRRAERLLAARHVTRLDHAMLVATLAAHRPQMPDSVQTPMAEPVGASVEDPLVELILAGPDWRRALAAQRGCFSRAEAGRRINGS
jgi:hypothetical protein